jgi:hypothetical protein
MGGQGIDDLRHPLACRAFDERSGTHSLHDRAERVALGIDHHHGHAALGCNRRNVHWQRSGSRGAHDDDQGGTARCFHRALESEIPFIVPLVEPQNMGPPPGSARRAPQELPFPHAGQTALFPCHIQAFRKEKWRRKAFSRAAHEVDVAVDLIRPLGRVAGPKVQSIDVLCDQQKAATRPPLRSDQSSVRGVGLRRSADSTSIQIPRPHFFGHALKGSPGGQLLRMVVPRADFPVTLSASKRRDAAFRRNPGAGQPEHQRVRSMQNAADGIVEHGWRQVVAMRPRVHRQRPGSSRGNDCPSRAIELAPNDKRPAHPSRPFVRRA